MSYYCHNCSRPPNEHFAGYCISCWADMDEEERQTALDLQAQSLGKACPRCGSHRFRLFCSRCGYSVKEKTTTLASRIGSLFTGWRNRDQTGQ